MPPNPPPKMMKKLLPFLLALLAAATVAPAREGSPPRSTPAKPAPSERENLVSRVESCEAILREFTGEKNRLIPAEVLKQARAIIIVNQFKAGFIFGVQGGYGVILVKRANGWSVPALIRAGEASLGLQLGGKSVETVYVITDDQTPRLLLNGRFDIGADAKAVAGPKVAEADAWKDGNPLKIPVLVYSKKAGLYAGATVKAGFVSRDDEANHLLYSTTYNLPELLYGDFVKVVPEVQYLQNYVKKIAP
jgi:lipid-binding SYLF domain-containing protein